MSGLDQLQYATWLLYLIVFVLVLMRTISRPTPAHLDMTLFFGAAAIVIIASAATKLQAGVPRWLGEVVPTVAAMALGYLLLRLVHDFSHVPLVLMRAVELGVVASIVAIVLLPAPMAATEAVVLVLYLAMVIGYCAWAFAQQARRSRGVTRRRMQAAAIGSLCVDLALVTAGLDVVLPTLSTLWALLGAALGLASGVCYFIGFAPPTWLRRAWQEPDVRAFLRRATSLARLPDMRQSVQELERLAADALGAPAATIGLWDRDRNRLRIFYDPPPALDPDANRVLAPDHDTWDVHPEEHPPLARAWVNQEANLVTDAARADPGMADFLALYGARAVMSAPITAYEKRLGVLSVYAPRAPVFANSDLELIQLAADQAALVLESQTLIDEAARMRAREEAARLKEDFLSSAAHDLKTPLTGIVTQAQILRRRAERDPAAPPDRVGLDRLLEQSQRMKKLVLDLLDVSRLEQSNLMGEREELDLTELVQTIVQHEGARWKRVQLDSAGPVRASVDPPRFEQVILNLVENALKYSEPKTPVVVSVCCEDGEARLSVRDEGIGIPADDRPLVFERFHRARNVDDRRFAGMGLGLYITRSIVEQHGGRIWVESTPGVGSTFVVAVPSVMPVAAVPENASDRTFS